MPIVTPRTVLIVCHANTSRSVIAQALLRRMLAERRWDAHWRVASGGIAPYARSGALVSLDAVLALRDEGIDLPRDSVATDLKRDRHLIDQADLILAMTDEQVRMLRAGWPEAADKPIYTLKSFAGGGGDIDDPAGRDESVFAACRDEIKACLERAIARFAEP